MLIKIPSDRCLINQFFLTEIRNSKIWNRNFVEGWSFLDSNRDSHDSDWEKIKLFIRKNILWFFLHLGISEVTKRNFRSDVSLLFESTPLYLN